MEIINTCTFYACSGPLPFSLQSAFCLSFFLAFVERRIVSGEVLEGTVIPGGGGWVCVCVGGGGGGGGYA